MQDKEIKLDYHSMVKVHYSSQLFTRIRHCDLYAFGGGATALFWISQPVTCYSNPPKKASNFSANTCRGGSAMLRHRNLAVRLPCSPPGHCLSVDAPKVPRHLAILRNMNLLPHIPSASCNFTSALFNHGNPTHIKDCRC